MAFTKEQIELLAAPLDGKHVSERKIAGRKMSYIEGWHAIAEANRIFGFDSWSRETYEMKMVTETHCPVGRERRDGWRVGYIAKVRVSVRDMDHVVMNREGTGYGSGIDVDVGTAHESAVKEAETDAMKRALMTFGNPFGLALYDKTQAEVVYDEAPDLKAIANAALERQRGGQEDAPVSGRLAEWVAKVVAALNNTKTPKEVDALQERCKEGLMLADREDRTVALDIQSRFTARRLVVDRAATLNP